MIYAWIYFSITYIYTRKTATSEGVSPASNDEGFTAALGGGKKSIGAPEAPQMVLSLLQGHEDSKYVLSFEIGQRESGFYSERTKWQTEWQNHPVAY